MATHKPFRELVKPGTNFEFIGRARLWATVSILLIAASIAMLFVNKRVRGDYLNWTIDFKGGTELIFEFFDKSDPQARVEVDAGDIRAALQAAGFGGFDVSDYRWDTQDAEGNTVHVHGMLVRTPDFGALAEDEAERLRQSFIERAEKKCMEGAGASETAEEDCKILTASWSGDRIFVRSKQLFPWKDAAEFFADNGKTLKKWDQTDTEIFTRAEEGTGEYNAQYTIEGLDKQFREALDKGIGDVVTHVVNVYGVGAKAGAQLRNDGIKSLFYAMALIVLYLAFRFDIRYCPGAIVALLHDAILVTGVFALFYVDVSLTSIAALLTVIGYSVNDTVVIFDRIRENVGRLKDKKLERIINISLNETLSRTLLTSITLLVVTLMMNIFGAGLVKNFAFAMNCGVVVGVYSSVFVASPVLLFMDRKFYPPKGPVKGEGAKKRSATKAKKKAGRQKN